MLEITPTKDAMVEGVGDLLRSIFSTAEDTSPDLMVMSYDFYVYFAAHQHFGKPVNRSNRHKFRRSLLYITQTTERRAESE